MASPIIRPELSESQLMSLKSAAEAKFYRACREQLKEKYLVLHSIMWIHRTVTGEPRDGEADFVIFDPDRGFIVVEIKGGGISHDAVKDVWYSVDKHGSKHEIKDPFRQASSEKHAILEQIINHKEKAKYLEGRLLAGHAVFFPDLDDLTKLVLPQGPKDILGGREHLGSLDEWVDQVFSYWSGQAGKYHPLGKVGLSIINDIFCREIFVKPLLKAQLQEEEERRIKLTEQQSRVFRMLGNRKKAAICGGAGTGKTLLALQRARELAASGKKTLLLCYNQPLGDWLGICAHGTENLRALNFHKLCEEQIRKAKALAGRDLVAEAKLSYPGEDEWDVLKPFALATSTEILDDKYDAIVIDEGQDFKDEYWLGIEMLFSNIDDGYLYIFYDDNQSLYKCSSEFPITEPPFVLTVNCRNTEFIHNFSYNFYEGYPTDPPEIKGTEIDFIPANTLDSQATKVHALVLDLIQKEGVLSEQIVVLVGGKPFKSYSDKLETKPLPKPNIWGSRLHGQRNSVLIETIGRFKGLESDIVILWGVENLDKTSDREAFYVATSRAKSRLFVVGTDVACNYLQQS